MHSPTHCPASYQCFAFYLVSGSSPCHSTSQAICSVAYILFCILQESSEDTTFEPQDAAASLSGRSSPTQSWSSRERPNLIQWLCCAIIYMCMSVAILLCYMTVYVQQHIMQKSQILSAQSGLSALHANSFYHNYDGIPAKQ